MLASLLLHGQEWLWLCISQYLTVHVQVFYSVGTCIVLEEMSGFEMLLSTNLLACVTEITFSFVLCVWAKKGVDSPGLWWCLNSFVSTF